MALARFLLFYHLFAVAVGISSKSLEALFPQTAILSPHFWLIFVTVFALTLIAYFISDFGIRTGGESSVYFILGGLFIKLFLSLAIVGVFIIKFPENKMLTALNFFSLYFLFTIFEVTCLLRNLRDQNQM